MKNNYKKITSLILIILFTVLQFFSSYSYINFFITPQFYETNDDRILIIERGKNKKPPKSLQKPLTNIKNYAIIVKKFK